MKRSPKTKTAESYLHPEADLPMRPEVGTQAQFKKKKPPQTYRECILSRDERQEVMTAIRDQAFRSFVFAMQETGCRPSSLRKRRCSRAKRPCPSPWTKRRLPPLSTGRSRAREAARSIWRSRLWRSPRPQASGH